MSAATQDITIEQGVDYSIDLAVTIDAVAWDLTGYTAEATVREDYNTAATSMTATITNAAGGLITVSLTAAQTALLFYTSGVWDLIVTSGGGVVTRLLQGTVTVTKSVTH